MQEQVLPLHGLGDIGHGYSRYLAMVANGGYSRPQEPCLSAWSHAGEMKPEELLESVPTRLWIAGAPADAETGATFEVHNPATGETIAHVADATPADGLRALDAAVAAGPAWAATPARERGEILRAVYEAIIARTEEFSLLMTLEMGKALAESRNEVRYGAEFFRWFSEEAVRIQGRYQTAPGGTGRILVHQQPVGPCLAITPWNFPLAMGTRKIGPALAAGCTMLVKPARETPLTMLLLAQLCTDAGLPAGVLSVLPTSRASAVTGPLIDDPRLRKLTFTGSTPIGKALVRNSANRLLRTSMELGGNAPFVVFDDADIDAAVDGAMLAKLRNGGEACTAANRFHVQNSVLAEFTDKLVERMSQMRLGAGIDPETTSVRSSTPINSRSSVSWSTTPSPKEPPCVLVARHSVAPAGSIPPPCSPTSPPTPAFWSRRCSAPSPPSPASRPRPTASPPPTTPNTA